MTIESTQITAVILAGGKGSRLGGQDKGLVEYQGKRLIDHALETIVPQVGKVIINANRNVNTYSDLGHTVISDEMSDFQGPLAGFAIAMQMAETDYIVTMPCDGPNLNDDYVGKLLVENKNNDKNTIVVAHDGERLQPVHALIPVSLLASLQTFLHSGDRKIDRWYAQNTMVTADFSDTPDVFFNVNTEAQRQGIADQNNKQSTKTRTRENLKSD